MRDRFETKFEPITESGCWIWMAGRFDTGYGSFWLNGTDVRAHRVAYELYVGAIPEGMWVLHRCDIRECVNPDHLFLGTHQDNMDDMARKGRHANSIKTHCRKGHPYTEENTVRYKNGRRVCRTCAKEHSRNRSEVLI